MIIPQKHCCWDATLAQAETHRKIRIVLTGVKRAFSVISDDAAYNFQYQIADVRPVAREFSFRIALFNRNVAIYHRTRNSLFDATRPSDLDAFDRIQVAQAYDEARVIC